MSEGDIRIKMELLTVLSLFSVVLLGTSADQRVLLANGIDENTGTNCRISKVGRFDAAKRGQPVRFSDANSDSFEWPGVEPLNATAGEQWEFDGISSDGKASFIFGFYRDPNYSILGTGNLRASIEATFANGTRYGHVDYAAESIIKECDEGIRGVWRDADEGYTYAFDVSSDMSHVRLEIDHPVVTGSASIKSRIQPRFANAAAWPSDGTASTEALPFFHWFEPVPAGNAQVSLDFGASVLEFTGMGGHNRFWSAFSWFSCLTEMNAVRMIAGPYSLSLLELVSNVDKGLRKTSVVLANETGEHIFASTQLGDEDASADYVTWSKSYDVPGAVSGSLKDRPTGYRLDLVSPSRKRHWTFAVEHRNLAFEFMLGEGVGGSGFSAVARGGHIGLAQYEGVALTETLVFPKKSPLFKSNYKDEL